MVSSTSICIGTALINTKSPTLNRSDFIGTTYIFIKSTGASSSYLSVDEYVITNGCKLLVGNIRGSAAEEKMDDILNACFGENLFTRTRGSMQKY